MKFNIKKKDLIYVGIVIFLLFLLKCSHDSKKSVDAEIILKNNNIEAMQDTIKTKELKNGQLVSQKMAMIIEISDLKNYNDSIYKRVNELSDELDARPVIYISSGVKIIHDTTEVERIVFRINDSTFYVPFNKDTIYSEGNERHIAGELHIITKDSTIKIDKFSINRDELIFTAEVVLTEDGDKLIANVTSDHPGFSTKSITPIVLDPRLHPKLKKLNNKRFIVGPYFGIGIGQNFSIQPQVGIGLTYKIIAF